MAPESQGTCVIVIVSVVVVIGAAYGIVLCLHPGNVADIMNRRRVFQDLRLLIGFAVVVAVRTAHNNNTVGNLVNVGGRWRDCLTAHHHYHHRWVAVAARVVPQFALQKSRDAVQDTSTGRRRIHHHHGDSV